MMNSRASFLLCLASCLFIAACKAETRQTGKDTVTTARAPVPVASVVAVNPGWDVNQAGPVLLLPVSDNSAIASVVVPLLTDSTLAQSSPISVDSLAGMSFDLFGTRGSQGTARIEKDPQLSASEGCLSWPVMALNSKSFSWQFGFRQGIATPLVLDSLEGVSAPDSLRITTELARLASALPESNDPAFQGLPFSVRKAYRGEKGSILIGDVVRKINEEANPREEHYLIVAERAVNGDTPYNIAFHTRAAGPEDAVRTTEILGAVRFVDGGNTVIVVSFEYEDGGRVAIVERIGTSWKLVWRSAYTGC